jgi:hypothetical protein
MENVRAPGLGRDLDLQKAGADDVCAAGDVPVCRVRGSSTERRLLPSVSDRNRHKMDGDERGAESTGSNADLTRFLTTVTFGMNQQLMT